MIYYIADAISLCADRAESGSQLVLQCQDLHRQFLKPCVDAAAANAFTAVSAEFHVEIIRPRPFFGVPFAPFGDVAACLGAPCAWEVEHLIDGSWRPGRCKLDEAVVCLWRDRDNHEHVAPFLMLFCADRPINAARACAPPQQHTRRRIADVALPDADIREDQYIDGVIFSSPIPSTVSRAIPTVAARILCGGPSAPLAVGLRVRIDHEGDIGLVVMSFNDPISTSCQGNICCVSSP
jgi:hypothetical protein